jgi:hypothetical protein
VILAARLIECCVVLHALPWYEFAAAVEILGVTENVAFLAAVRHDEAPTTFFIPNFLQFRKA